MYWEEDSAFSNEDSADFQMFACNTRKVFHFYNLLKIINIMNRTRTREFVDILLVCFLAAGHAV